VGGLTARFEGSREIEPEILPLLVGPAVVALKPRDTAGQAVPDQLAKGVVLGLEVRGSDGPPRRA